MPRSRSNAPLPKRVAATRQSTSTLANFREEPLAQIKQYRPSEAKDLLRDIEVFNLIYVEQKDDQDAISELTFLRSFHKMVTKRVADIRHHEPHTDGGRPSSVPRYLLLILTEIYFHSTEERLPTPEKLNELTKEWINENNVNRSEWIKGSKSEAWTCSISSARDFLSWVKKQNETGKPWNKKSFCRFVAQYKWSP